MFLEKLLSNIYYHTFVILLTDYFANNCENIDNIIT